MYKSIPLLLLFFASVATFSQPGKDGALTISSGSVVVNSYAPISSNISAGSSTLSLPNENLMRLCVGDLIMVYQAQGVSTNTTTTINYGDITSYNSAGLYEFKYVYNVNGTVVTTQSAFTNSYSLSGKPQVIKVPQYTTLTINSGSSLVPKAWKDTIISGTNYRFGGLVVIHASNIVNNGTITSSKCGFRGGAVANSNGVYGHTLYTSYYTDKGAEKGEGLSGYKNDYDYPSIADGPGRYCRGAAANAGGGGNCYNSGGGGGANGFNGNLWTGQGVMTVDANNLLAAWALDPGYISNSNALTNSSGGGRGGYTYGYDNRNAAIDGPNNIIWGGDYRREAGGLGGRSLTNINAENRIYFGGGGGAGEANESGGSSGGNGGGIVYLIATSGITGSGVISSNGETASNSTIDGAGGGGAGGSIVLKANTAATQTVFANGGNGGNHFLANMESLGPGGGGGGGFIAVASVGPMVFVNGGLNGISNSTALAGIMTANGATKGASGQFGPVTNAFITFSPIIWSVNSNTPCTGFDLLLTSNSSYPFSNFTYQWLGPNGFSSGSQNPSIVNAPSLAAGVYSLSIPDNVGCGLIYTTSINVIVDLTPTLSAIGSTVCAGQTITLGVNSSAGINFDWTGLNSFAATGPSPFIPNAQTNMSGAYNVTVTSAFGCTNSAIANVVVNPTPVILSANGSTVCAGQNLTLNLISPSGASFQWNNPFGSLVATSQNVTVPNAQLIMTGIYDVTVTSVYGCTNTASANVIVNPTPTLSASGSTACSGQNISLGAISSTGINFGWTGPDFFTATSPSTFIPNCQTNMSGAYVVTVTNAVGCANTATVDVLVNPTPTLSAIGSTVCEGQNLTLNLNSSAATTIQWADPVGSLIATTQNVALANAQTNMAGVYNVTVTSVNGCTNTISANVVVNLTPTLSASGSTVCSGQNVTLDVNSSTASNFQWDGPNSFLASGLTVAIPNSQTNISGIYNVIVTTAAGCSKTASVNVLVKASPILIVSGSTVCAGQSANLSASGGLSYSWIGPNGFVSLLKDITIPIANDETAGNYTVTATAANACKSIDFAKLIANPLPIPELTTKQNIQNICINDQINLQSKSAGFTAYRWSGPDGFLSFRANSSFKAISVNQGGTYTLNVIDTNSCNGFTTTIVVVNTLPEATLSVNNNKNCVPFCSNFSLQTTESSKDLVSTLWIVNGRGANSNYCFKQSGKYAVKADFIDAAGCSNTATYNVIAYPSPSSNFEFAPLHPVENKDEVIFYDGSEGDNIVSRNWYFEKDTVYQVTKQNPSYLFTNSGLYPVALVVKNKFGCADTMVKIVAIGEDYSFYVPNTFTPNDDGVNDTFEPKGHGISKYNMTVFDRWGKKVFVTTDFSQSWDGKYSGQDCEDDIYAWQVTITLSDFRVKTYTGHVTLYR